MINSSIENMIPTLCKLEQIVQEISGLWDFSFQSFTSLLICNKTASRTSRYLASPIKVKAAQYCGLGYCFIIVNIAWRNAVALSLFSCRF